ncbi:MAG: sugar transferase [Clostridia bacterium]|nr:sugar transferase [Clostridia bacterium]
MVYKVSKRIFDVVSCMMALILLAPVFLIIAIAIKCDSRGPVFYKHHRIGKNGVPFGMYKFRSMIVDADKAFDTFTPEQMEEYEENYKLDNDPRVTKVGNFLRRTSLDELPQLVNVIKGDISIVGPRPIVEKELESQYTKAEAEKFLSVIPGITGYWQANGRSSVSYKQRKALELYYVDNASFMLDIKIIFKTFSAVLKRDGAK